MGAVRESGSSGVSVTIGGPSGQLFSGTIPASQYPARGVQSFIPGGANWGSIDIGRIVFENGKEYTVEFSTSGGTQYGVVGIHEGTKGYTFNETTTFSDGHAEVNEGSGWVGWHNLSSQPSTAYDMTMYFELE